MKNSERSLKFNMGSKIMLIFLTLSILIFSKDIDTIEKLNVPREYFENIKIENFQNENVEYDFNNDGIKEKVLISYKEEKETLKVYISIYVLNDNKYKLKYQFPLEKNIHILNMGYTKNQFNKIKEYYNEYSKNIGADEVRYIKISDVKANDKIKIDLKYDKYSPKNLDEFLFVEKNTTINNNPIGNVQPVKELKYKDKPKVLFETFSEDNGNNKKWYFVEITQDNNVYKGFIGSENRVIKRGFYFDKMQTKIEKLNKFIEEARNNKQQLYTIKEYRPMRDDIYSKRDKFGNRNNQSVYGYSLPDKKGEIINIPDRTIFKIIGKKDNMVQIESPYYGKYYIENNPANIEKWDLKEKVDKFIVMDTYSQTEAIFERDKNKFKIITYSFVTTGKDNGFSSYETPRGMFLVAYTRPYMAFGKKVKDVETQLEKVEISGTAKGAVRFSGGGYMHGIPVSKDNEKYVRPVIEGKIGTYKESHKCVRHYDGQIDFIIKWINGEERAVKEDKLVPEHPVVAIIM